MRTAGVDLAAEPPKTAIASIEWSASCATVVDLQLGAKDDAIVAAVHAADKAGIDCPFGWPAAFVDFVAAHHAGNVIAPEDVAGIDWRRRLAYRVTDAAVRHTTGLRPLSVAADRIAHTAMRCASLLTQLSHEGETVDRSGAGVVVEVYPAASLRGWGLAHQGYKGRDKRPQRGALVDSLLAAAPWLRLGEHEAACRRSDDALDAVVAAITARAAFVGRTAAPTTDQLVAARTEGWIAVPSGSLSDLLDP